jgi:hypothetical protein
LAVSLLRHNGGGYERNGDREGAEAQSDSFQRPLVGHYQNPPLVPGNFIAADTPGRRAMRLKRAKWD